jgi:hypothetical protein
MQQAEIPSLNHKPSKVMLVRRSFHRHRRLMDIPDIIERCSKTYRDTFQQLLVKKFPHCR